MKHLLIALTLLFAFSTPCLAKWGKEDTALLILRAIDWQQTRVIATETLPPKKYEARYKDFVEFEPEYKYTEQNPLLGEHPSPEDVDRYFAALVLVDVLIALFGPDWLHHTWNGIQIAAEFYCVGNNFNAGIRIKF